MRAALTDPQARQRGLGQTRAIPSRLADPNTTRITLGSNTVWQLALLERWLQHHHVG